MHPDSVPLRERYGLLLANGDPAPLRETLDQAGDLPLRIFDKFDRGSLLGEAGRGMGEERDSSGAILIDHQPAVFHRHHELAARRLVDPRVLRSRLGRDSKFFAACSHQVRR